MKRLLVPFTCMSLAWLLSAASSGQAPAAKAPAARAPAAQASGGPVSEALRSQWNTAKRNIRDSAKQMPEADYSFKPTDKVRTFGQILAHVADGNYEFCSPAKGEKAPYTQGDFEKSATTKASIAKALDDSFAYCDAIYNGLTDAKGAELIDMPFGMPRGARAGILMMNTGHLNEHYGNLVTYFRIKGMVPPSTAREQPPPVPPSPKK